MKELYFISVLGTLKGIAIMLLVVSLITFISFIIWRINNQPFNLDYHDDEFCDKISKRGIKTSLIILLSAICITIFVPTRSELYTIYGVGTVIDYIQSNPEAQQLPDKTIKYLNIIADKCIEDNEK